MMISVPTLKNLEIWFIKRALFNVSSMKLLIVNQSVSSSPSKIRRGGEGALMPQEEVIRGQIILLRPNGHLPYLRGGVEYQQLIFVELTLNLAAWRLSVRLS